MKINRKCVVLALYSTIVFFMNLSYITSDAMKILDFQYFPLLTGYQGNSLISFLTVILFYFFYCYSIKQYAKIITGIKNKVCCRIPAIFFAGIMLLGYSFVTTNSWNTILAWENPLQLCKVLIAFCGYYIFFVFAICDVYSILDGNRKEVCKVGEDREIHLLEHFRDKDKKNNKFFTWYQKKWYEHPFWISFLTMFLLFLPELIVYYPTQMMPDPLDEICQVFGIKYYTAEYLELLKDNVVYTNHHPIVYTMFLKVGLMTGNALFHSYNIGLFLCVLVQAFCLIGAISFGLTKMKKYHIPDKVIFCMMALIVINPRIRNHIVVLTKDVMYTAFMLIVVICLIELWMENKNKKTVILLIFASVVSVFLRNDSIYVLGLSFLFYSIFAKGYRKQFAVMLAVIAAAYLLLHQVLMPMFFITPGSVREALSLPFLQTARYVSEYEEEVTEEEKKAIDGILNYDSLEENYVPDFSDYIKGTFKEFSSQEDLKNYIKTWYQMFWKHPGIYVEAAMNLSYGYFYPLSVQTYIEDNAMSYTMYYEFNERIAKENRKEISITQPVSLARMRIHFQDIREIISYLPGFSMLQTCAFYSWMLILWFFYCIRTRRKKSLFILIPLMGILGICTISPVGGWYFRYILPLAVCLPIVILLCYYGEKTGIPGKEFEDGPDCSSDSVL